MRIGRRGFTLTEVMVALAAGGLVLVAAHSVGWTIQERARRFEERRNAHDRDQNAGRWLREAFESLQVGQDTADSFDGRPTEVVFTTRKRTEFGWAEARRVRIGVSSGELHAWTDGGAVLLSGSVERVIFEYLLRPGEYPEWVREWRSPATAPVAVRMTIHGAAPADTSTRRWWLMIGRRG